MIARRLILTVVLVVFAAVTTGVIVGLSDAARSSLAQQLPGAATSAEPASTGATPAAVTPASTPTTAAPEPSANNTKAPQPSAVTKAPQPTPRPTTPAMPKPRKPSVPSKPRTPAKGKIVYLTFDDGPSPYTPQVLQILSRTGSTATFFQLGINAHGQGGIAALIRAQGSNIGNHSYGHRDLTTLTAAQLRWQIVNGPRSTCFRPPYGATNATVRKAIHRAGARQVLWSVDTHDWTKPGVAKLQKVGLSKHVTGGSIILMHDGGGTREQTVAALPKLIHSLQVRGYHVRALPYCS